MELLLHSPFHLYFAKHRDAIHLYLFLVESLAIFKLIPEEKVDIPNPTLMTTSFPVV